MTDRQWRDFVSCSLENLHGFRNGIAVASDHGLVVAVDVGDHHVAVDRLQDSFDFGQRSKDGGHSAGVGHGDAGHATTARADGYQRVFEGQSAGGDQCSVLAEAVAHRHVGLDAVGGEETRESEIDGQHGRLRDGGLAQIVISLRDGNGIGLVGISLVHEDKVGQRLAEQRRHDSIGFGKHLGDDRLRGVEGPQHVYVLRALSRIKKGHFRGRTLAAEDALRTQSLPHRGLIRGKCFECFGRLVREFGGVSIINGQALGSAQIGFGGIEHRS